MQKIIKKCEEETKWAQDNIDEMDLPGNPRWLKAGLLRRGYAVPNEKEVPTEETPSDLILRLLQHVGVYPVE